MSEEEKPKLRLAIQEIEITPMEIRASIAMQREMKDPPPAEPNPNKNTTNDPLTEPLAEIMSLRMGYSDASEIPALKELHDIILRQAQTFFNQQIEPFNYAETQEKTEG